jgi:hypothetical protein
MTDASTSLDWGLIDGAILGLPATEIADRLCGVVTPEYVVLRTKQLLAGNDWLTDAERERALLYELERRITQLRIADDLASIKVQSTILRDLLDRLERRQGVLGDQITVYSRAVAKEIVDLITLFAEHLRAAMPPGVDESRWVQLEQAAFVSTRHEIEARTGAGI